MDKINIFHYDLHKYKPINTALSFKKDLRNLS